MVKRGPRGPRKRRTLSIGRYASFFPSKNAERWRFVGVKTDKKSGDKFAHFLRRGELHGEALGTGTSLYLNGKKCKIKKISRKKIELECL